MTSGYDLAANGLAERWVGSVKVRATILLPDAHLPLDDWLYVCRWVAYVHTHGDVELPIDKIILSFGDVVVVEKLIKKPHLTKNVA